MKETSFNVGDRVEWESQSGGHYATKIGDIVQVVKAGDTPGLAGDTCGTLHVSGVGYGMARNHVSYLVRVENTGYWPRVKHLKLSA